MKGLHAYNPDTREQVLCLKDGRTIFKTHNGFRAFVEDRKGKVSPVTQKYYLKAHKIK